MIRIWKFAVAFGAAILCANTAFAIEFDRWLEALKTEALTKGISQSTLDAAFKGIKPIPRVVELDRKQPEFTLTYKQYMQRVTPNSRVQKGRRNLEANRKILNEVSRKYGVQPQFIVAFWGIETDFGRVTGGFKVIPALATLAHDGRRSKFFRRELFYALRILEEGHISAKNMVGSWAGAMGQSQFMPSSFIGYAVDHDGDGRKDIWTTKADVFASAANYLSKYGWRGDERWGRQITLPTGFDQKMVGLKTKKTIQEWAALGLTKANGAPLPRSDLSASVIQPAKEGGPAFLVYKNYRVILKWNRSHYFAMAVGHLADRIAAN
ncbi:MAG: lytic murein transglycosylase [Alphaproteobacteria bacterium]|nr:lytic murein transglycosylase [Alphaproteobacteria bacterium]